MTAVRSPSKSPANRRGYLIVTVLIVLGLTMALFAVSLRMIALERRVLRTEQAALQAEALAAAGLARAGAQLAVDRNYRGESWQATTATTAADGTAQVTIRVEDVASQPNQRQLVAVAQWGAGLQATRRTRETTIVLPTGKEQP